MVFAMAVIGAITRLTESGLSITEWKPVTGALPPLNEQTWQREFDLYRQTPEYAAKHFWMEIGDFKKIYFWEWIHRLWGRMIGLVFGLPLLWFWLRREIPKGAGWKFLGLLALGGMQGFIGWFMVQSGLADRPSVSHYRLAMHLSMALLVFAFMLWLALDFRSSLEKAKRKAWGGWSVLCLLSLTIIWGAFVAGLDAGLIYNTFPHMGSGLIPPDFGNMHHSPPGVQFTHRWLAISTFLSIVAYSCINRQERFAILTACMAFVQVLLGISTLLTQVNIGLAALHQAGAIILLSFLLISQHRLMHR